MSSLIGQKRQTVPFIRCSNSLSTEISSLNSSITTAIECFVFWIGSWKQKRLVWQWQWNFYWPKQLKSVNSIERSRTLKALFPKTFFTASTNKTDFVTGNSSVQSKMLFITLKFSAKENALILQILSSFDLHTDFFLKFFSYFPHSRALYFW